MSQIISNGVSFMPSLQDALKSLGLSPEQAAKNNRRALVAMGAWMVREMQKATTSAGQTQPGGPAWLPLSPAWEAFKTDEGYSELIGVYQGHMRNSMSYDVRKTEVESGATVVHGAYFDALRPITPEEVYAANHFQDIILAEWNRT
jgi:hypothetical protein